MKKSLRNSKWKQGEREKGSYRMREREREGYKRGRTMREREKNRG